MKNTLIILFVVASLLSSITVNAKTYKIACFKDYYPYSSVNKDSELKGIVIDWWNLWAEATGNEIVFIPTDIQGCIDKTVAGEVDAIAGIFYSDERMEQLSFADNILKMQTVVFSNIDLEIDSISQINTAVGVVKNDLSHDYFITKYPKIELEVYDSFLSLRYAVKQNDINIFVYDVPNPIGNYKPIPTPEGYEELAVLYTNNLRPAVKKDNQEMLNAIMNGIALISNEEIEEAVKQWDILIPIPNYKGRITVGSLLVILILGLLIMGIRIKRQKERLTKFESDTDINDIIDKGENDSIEFKSSLRWDYMQEKPNKILEQVIVKTISAFLNTTGGTLLIGVDDDGNILGLENDYKSFSKKNADGFMLALTNLINQNLGKRTHKYISINIISVNERDVCIINIQKSDKPVFIGKNEKEEFFIRASASSQPLGMKESFEYINSHWR